MQKTIVRSRIFVMPWNLSFKLGIVLCLPRSKGNGGAKMTWSKSSICGLCLHLISKHRVNSLTNSAEMFHLKHLHPISRNAQPQSCEPLNSLMLDGFSTCSTLLAFMWCCLIITCYNGNSLCSPLSLKLLQFNSRPFVHI